MAKTMPTIPTNRIHGTNICLREWLIFMVNVKKYTRIMDPMGYQMVKLLGFWSVSISSSTIPGAYIEEYQWKIDKLPRLPWLYRGENWCFVFLNLQIIWNKCDYMTSGYILALVISRNTVPLFLCRTMKRHRFHLTVACLYIYIFHIPRIYWSISSLYILNIHFIDIKCLDFEKNQPCLAVFSAVWFKVW